MKDPVKLFGLAVYRAWQRGDFMDMDGVDLQDLAESSGVVEEVPYRIAEHGEWLRDAWDYEEGDPTMVLTETAKKSMAEAE